MFAQLMPGYRLFDRLTDSRGKRFNDVLRNLLGWIIQDKFCISSLDRLNVFLECPVASPRGPWGAYAPQTFSVPPPPMCPPNEISFVHQNA